MPAKFNLLPKDSALNKEVIRANKFLKTATVVVIVIACIFMMAGASGLYYYTNLLNKEKDQYQNLKVTATSLENTEQSLVLIKDRTQKLTEILNSRQNIDTFLKQKSVIESLPENTDFTGLSVMQDESRLDLISGSSRSLAELFRDLQNQGLQTVAIRQVSYDPSRGYSISLYVQ